MGVYIKGFKPKDGLYQIQDGVIRKYKGKGGTVRPYELIEVKEPHGRLIDADALLQDEWTWFDDFGNYSGEGQLIEDAPVIIEATKEE